MIISVNQPYFSPFPGFFYKALCSDVFVLLDEVQFPRGTTWITRNRFKSDQGTLWMTVPVWRKRLGLQKINEVRICREGRWAGKNFESLKSAYANAPYFSDHFSFVESLFSSGFEKLIDLNLEIIEYLMKALGIDTQVILLSELRTHARGNPLLIEICRELGASRFLAQKAAGKYIDVNLFQTAEIQIEYFKPPLWVYPQLWGGFILNLSAFDLVFNCGPKSRDILIKQGSII